MLYDTKWDIGVAVFPGIEDFRLWLQKQNPRERYDWQDVWCCPAGRYMSERGKPFACGTLYKRISDIAKHFSHYGGLQNMMGVKP